MEIIIKKNLTMKIPHQIMMKILMRLQNREIILKIILTNLVWDQIRIQLISVAEDIKTPKFTRKIKQSSFQKFKKTRKKNNKKSKRKQKD